MDQSRRNQIAGMHDAQRQRAAKYKPKTPDIPTKHGCAGECTTPPPPPPISNSTENFTDLTSLPRKWWLMMGAASVVYALLCLRRR